MKCDADEIDIFSQQDEPLFMPPTRLLVVLASISQLLFTRLSALRCNVFATFSLFTLLSIAGQVNLSNCFLSQHLTQPLAHHRLNLPLQHCGLPVCSSRICRMEVGLGKMKTHLSIAARLSPALGVLFWAAFNHAGLQTDVNVTTFWCIFVFLPPLSCACFEKQLFWPHFKFVFFPPVLRTDCYGFTLPSAWVLFSAALRLAFHLSCPSVAEVKPIESKGSQ